MIGLLRFINEHVRYTKWFVLCVSMIPFLLLLYRNHYDLLGVNPLNTLLHTSGNWAITFLILTLLMTPLRRILQRVCILITLKYARRLSDWNWLIKIRRILGNYCFFYACVHLIIYLYFDQLLDIELILLDVTERPFLLFGLMAFVLLIPLAVTSTNGMMRRLGGRNWRRLHKSVYVISLLVVVHFVLLTKVGVYTYVPYVAAILLLLLYRLLGFIRVFRFHDDGMECPERAKS